MKKTFIALASLFVSVTMFAQTEVKFPAAISPEKLHDDSFKTANMFYERELAYRTSTAYNKINPFFGDLVFYGPQLMDDEIGGDFNFYAINHSTKIIKRISMYVTFEDKDGNIYYKSPNEFTFKVSKVFLAHPGEDMSGAWENFGNVKNYSFVLINRIFIEYTDGTETDIRLTEDERIIVRSVALARRNLVLTAKIHELTHLIAYRMEHGLLGKEFD